VCDGILQVGEGFDVAVSQADVHNGQDDGERFSPDRDDSGTVGRVGRLPDNLPDLPGHFLAGWRR